MTATETSAPLRMVATTCCICGKAESDLVGSGDDFEYGTSPDTFRIVRCRTCELVYLNPRPHDDELSRIYPPSYHAFDFSPARFGLVFKIRRRLEARRLLSYAKGIPAEAAILDVGCGDGFHLRLLKDFGPSTWTLEGVDTSPAAIAAARADGSVVHQGRIESLELRAADYDLVLLIQTIEHLNDPLATLVAIARLLKPAGRLVVVTDNVRSLDFGLFRRRHWGGYHFPRHWTLFEGKTLTKLAAKAGLRPASVGTIVSPVNWVYSLRNWLQDHGVPRVIYDRFSLKSPIALAAFTVVDRILSIFGRGALLCVRFQRADSRPTRGRP